MTTPRGLPAGRWLFYLAGTAMTLTGVVGLLGMRPLPLTEIRLAAVSLLVHDALLAPVVLAVGVLLVRTVPAAARPYVQVGLLISGAVTLVALPLVLGAGRRADVPSALPLDYGDGLLLTLAATWVTIGTVAAIRLGVLRRRATRRPRPRPTARSRPRTPPS